MCEYYRDPKVDCCREWNILFVPSIMISYGTKGK